MNAQHKKSLGAYYQILPFIIFSLIFLNACGEGKSKKQVEEVPAVCTNTCKSWEIRTDYPDCQCRKPDYKLPDGKLQAQLITAVMKNNLKFIQEQVDVNHINPDAYLGLKEMENILTFRESISQNKVLYNNIKRNTDNLTLAYLAASDSNVSHKILEFLAEREADFNKPSLQGRTPIEVAILNRNLSVLPVLLKNGAKLDLFSNNENYLGQAIERKDIKTIKALVEYANSNDIDISSLIPPLENLIKQKDKDLISILIDKAGADPNQLNSKGEPILVNAALTGKKEIVTMLMLAGADVNKPNIKEQTPLMLLIQSAGSDSANMNEMALFLVANGADLNATDIKGESAIFYAVRNKDEKLIKNLIEQGADINARNDKGETPLFYAAATDNQKMAKFLLENGADARIKNKQRINAATLAVQLGFMDTYDILESNR